MGQHSTKSSDKISEKSTYTALKNPKQQTPLCKNENTQENHKRRALNNKSKYAITRIEAMIAVEEMRKEQLLHDRPISTPKKRPSDEPQVVPSQEIQEERLQVDHVIKPKTIQEEVKKSREYLVKVELNDPPLNLQVKTETRRRSTLRTIVSGNRIPEPSSGLDLSYIYPRIIAMSFPATGLESLYRNPVKDVAGYLDFVHTDSYKIFNLCSEKTYDPKVFHNRVAWHGFEDHNPPPLDMIPKICSEIDSWLADPEHVAVIHCKAGKGRTGTIIACYLLHIGMSETPEEALYVFSKNRTLDGKGVTIPSQKRYVGYYSKCLKNGFPVFATELILKQVIFQRGPLVTVLPCIKVENMYGKELFHCKEKDPLKPYKGNVAFNIRIIVKGDFKLSFYDGDKKCFDLWLNSGMIDDTVVLKRWELDGMIKKDKDFKKFGFDFEITLHFERKDQIVK